MVSRAIILCGTEQVDPPLRTLKAGPLSVEFDNGGLRYVRIAGIEVLRGISFLVRNENWGTFSPEITGLEIEEGADSFSVRYRGRCRDAQRDLVYDATITGGSDGSLAFDAVAEPLTDVLTNRTGFIVLHPVEGVAGSPVRIEHTDGSRREARFPETIDPRCPFKDVRAMSHEIAPGCWATCTMEGDAYETEDQRNWSDASYKTYIRPLTKPWPYTLPKGEKIVQSVRLSISGPLPEAAGGDAGGAVSVSVGEKIGAMPRLGLGVQAAEAGFALDNIELVRRLAPRWLVCEVDLRKGHGRAELDAYRKLGEATGAEIVLEIITLGSMDPDGELAGLARATSEAGLSPAAVSVFPQQELKSYQPDQPWPEMPSFEQTYAAARKAFPRARIGGGMAAYFTELNRKRPPAGPLDYVSHTTCPNVHAADDISVMETNEAIPYQILSTRAFMGGGLEYRIGPSQLGCRENPYGKANTPNPDNVRVCLSDIDPRQRGLFNAAWMLGYIAACARGGVDWLALGAPSGPFGHIHRRSDASAPYFDELSGRPVYPGFHVIAGLAALSGAELLDTTLSSKGSVEALAVRRDGRTQLWIANLTAAAVTAEFGPLPGSAKLAMVDASGFERLTTDPAWLDTAAATFRGSTVTLDAYAVARISFS
ncbi:MAG: hypothetical protein KF914_00420 [Rhizobiaceae bacterium]|nr:hypothetical protein [Rhizobiaceae bacterium]